MRLLQTTAPEIQNLVVFFKSDNVGGSQLRVRSFVYHCSCWIRPRALVSKHPSLIRCNPINDRLGIVGERSITKYT